MSWSADFEKPTPWGGGFHRWPSRRCCSCLVFTLFYNRCFCYAASCLVDLLLFCVLFLLCDLLLLFVFCFVFCFAALLFSCSVVAFVVLAFVLFCFCVLFLCSKKKETPRQALALAVGIRPWRWSCFVSFCSVLLLWLLLLRLPAAPRALPGPSATLRCWLLWLLLLRCFARSWTELVALLLRCLVLVLLLVLLRVVLFCSVALVVVASVVFWSN